MLNTYLLYGFIEILGLQIPDPSQFYYLNRTGGVYTVPDTNDTEDFIATKVGIVE